MESISTEFLEITTDIEVALTFSGVALQCEKKQMTLMAHFSTLRPCTLLPRNRMCIGPGYQM